MCLCVSLISCWQESRNVRFFKNTEVYKLAQAVGKENLKSIEKIVKENPELLNVTNEISGSNVLSLSLTLENFEAFKKLLELGADPNFVNPYSKRSILINACKFYWKPKPYSIDLRYIELLLEYGANPNYVVEEKITDEEGISYMPTSPLIQASSLSLDMVKLLIKAGADPYKKLKENQKAPFSESLSGNKFDIIYYFIDSLGVNLKEPLYVVNQKPSNEIVEFYIQDYIEIHMGYVEGTEAYIKKQQLIQKLESMGVDFRNYTYKH